jgi:hypothetical protein
MKDIRKIREESAIRRAEFLRLISESKYGMTRQEVSELTQSNRPTTIESLRVMRELGQIVVASNFEKDPFARWCVASNLEAAMKKIRADRVKRVAEEKKRRLKYERERMRAKRKEQELDPPIIKRIVSNWRPMRRIPVNSVFSLGAA